MKFFSRMPYDVITTGNHELYKYPVALSTYENVAAHYGSRYLTSNVNITLPGKGGRSVPLGNRFAKFRTEQGRRVTAFGPLFCFKGNVVRGLKAEDALLIVTLSACAWNYGPETE